MGLKKLYNQSLGKIIRPIYDLVAFAVKPYQLLSQARDELNKVKRDLASKTQEYQDYKQDSELRMLKRDQESKGLAQTCERLQTQTITTGIIYSIIAKRALEIEQKASRLEVAVTAMSNLVQQQKSSIHNLYSDLENAYSETLRTPVVRKSRSFLVNQKGIVYDQTARLREEAGDWKDLDLSGAVDFDKNKAQVRINGQLYNLFIEKLHLPLRKETVQHYWVSVKKAAVYDRLKDSMRRGDNKAVSLETQNVIDVTNAQVESRKKDSPPLIK